ncbi:MAG: hypothetical protein WA823_15335 [Candidatus Acidiferrales bacterium]
MVPVPVIRTETIHNSRGILAICVLFSLGSWALSSIGAMMTIYMLMQLKVTAIWSVLGALQWLVFAYCFFAVARMFWRLSVKAWNSRVVLDSAGMNFHYAKNGGYADYSMPWGSIESVSHKRVGNCQTYTVNGNEGAYFRFNSYTFMRPKKIATRIAAACGNPIVEEK